MIGKDYFKRQATTLRKMVEVAQDRVVAAQLNHLAEDFEAKAEGGPDAPNGNPGGPSAGADDRSHSKDA